MYQFLELEVKLRWNTYEYSSRIYSETNYGYLIYHSHSFLTQLELVVLLPMIGRGYLSFDRPLLVVASNVTAKR